MSTKKREKLNRTKQEENYTPIVEGILVGALVLAVIMGLCRMCRR